MNLSSQQAVIKTQLEEQSLVILVISRLFKDKGIKWHTKCINRTNVFRPADLVVSEITGSDTRAYFDRKHMCPFMTTNGCSIIERGLTLPAACAKRIIVENPELEPLAKPLGRAARYISQMVKLLGDRK